MPRSFVEYRSRTFAEPDEGTPPTSGSYEQPVAAQAAERSPCCRVADAEFREQRDQGR